LLVLLWQYTSYCDARTYDRQVVFIFCIFETLGDRQKAEGEWFHKAVIFLNTIYRLVLVMEIQFVSCKLLGVFSPYLTD